MHEFQTSGPCQFCNIANSTLPPALWLVRGAPVSAALVSSGERRHAGVCKTQLSETAVAAFLADMRPRRIQ